MKVLVAAGGTGGHIYPAIALIQNLKRKLPHCSILWVGGKKKFERKIVEQETVQFKSLPLSALPRSFSLQWIGFSFKLFSSFIESLKIIATFKPDIVLGMGSFHSYPLGLLAFLLRIPIIICEQNMCLSLTNRMLLPFASKIALSFESSMEQLSSRSKKKAVVTGNPIRETMLSCSKKESIEKLNLEENKSTLMFLGGSQGAHHLNKLAFETLYLMQQEKYAHTIQFIIIAGESDYDWLREKMKKITLRGKIFSYLSDVHYALAAGNLAVSRSGATTIAEITAYGIPAILIPYPFATNNHQLTNALFMERKGAAKVMKQEHASASLLKQEIEPMLFDSELRDAMSKASRALSKPEAAEKIANLIVQSGKN